VCNRKYIFASEIKKEMPQAKQLVEREALRASKCALWAVRANCAWLHIPAISEFQEIPKVKNHLAMKVLNLYRGSLKY
jgi:hypothetical protein